MARDPDTSEFGPVDPSPVYLPLSNNQIRLLKPVLTSSSEELAFDLSIHDLDSKAQYYSLSYTWGRPAADRFIVCNGQKFGVTENLFQALKRLRSNIVVTDLVRSKPQEEVDPAGSLLWIDQICINQADIQEKVQQIKRMREIFSRAIRTLVWYGLDISAQIAEYMVHFGKIAASRKKIIQESFDISMIDLPDATSSFWIELHDFLSRAWTTRVWVIQEAALSPVDPILLCGRQAFGLRGMCLTVTELNWISYTDNHLMSMFRPINNGAFFGILKDLRTQYSSPKENSRRVHLADLLYSLPTMHATDNRDLVYGVLGLTHFADKPTHNSISIVPDYDRDTYELFRAVARYAIISTGSLKILAKTGEFSRTKSDLHHCQLEQPSWTPRFDTNKINESGIMVKNRSYFGDDMTMYAKRLLKFHATPGKSAEMREKSADNKLTVKGLRIDMVDLAVAPEIVDHELNKNSTSIKQWEAALKYFNINADTPRSELRSFGNKFFAVTHPFAWDNGQAQCFRSDSKSSLRYCCEEMHRAYQDKGDLGSMQAQILKKYTEYSLTEEYDCDNDGDGYEIDGASLNLAVEDTFFITKAGYMGFGARPLREGDYTSVLYGSDYPIALERCGDEYHFLGEIFIKEYLNGEALLQRENGEESEKQPEWITLH